MVAPFGSEHERIKRISQLRSESAFPDHFEHEDAKYTAVRSVILWLLSENPTDRPSSSELQASDRIPKLGEDATFKDVVARLQKPESSQYKRLISELFQQQSNSLRDRVYDDYSTRNSRMEQAVVDAKCLLELVFRRHGAIEIATPLLIPLSRAPSEPIGATMMDRAGGLVQLPYDHRAAFARYIAKKHEQRERSGFDNDGGEKAKILRRFDFSSVFRTSLEGVRRNISYMMLYAFVLSISRESKALSQWCVA